MRYNHEIQELYPNFRKEMLQHDNRIDAIKDLESLVSRFEQFVRQKALHYKERPCDECGQVILDIVMNTMHPGEDLSKGPQFMSDWMGCKTYCKNCPKSRQ